MIIAAFIIFILIFLLIAFICIFNKKDISITDQEIEEFNQYLNPPKKD